MDSRADHALVQAPATVDAPEAGRIEKMETRVELALGPHQGPKSPTSLHGAVKLYDRALESCPPGEAPPGRASGTHRVPTARPRCHRYRHRGRRPAAPARPLVLEPSSSCF